MRILIMLKDGSYRVIKTQLRKISHAEAEEIAAALDGKNNVAYVKVN